MSSIGERIRELRVGLGISQTELARDLVSPSYVSLIEANKRVPEDEVVVAFASRLDTTVEFLRTGVDPVSSREEELVLRFADLALANGQIGEALGQFQRVAGEGGVLRHAAAWGMVRALEARGRVDEAVERVEWLLVETHAGRADVPGLLVLLTAQCRLYRLAGDLNRSVEVGEQAVATVQGLGLRDTEDEIRLVSSLLTSYWERGDWARAEVLAQEVVRRAEAHGSRRARGSAYWNASLVAESRGQTLLAIEFAERALAMFAEGEDERSVAILRTNYAWLLLRKDVPEVGRAYDLLLRARDMFVRDGLDNDLAHCETELARAVLLLGRPEDAREAALGALSRLDGRPVVEVARAYVMLAHALAQLGDETGALTAARARSHICW